ncbi:MULTISPECIES: D-alanine--D-alanine ligase family protein [unclassified Streptomyces]|uniref:D-alanine--D-alanine ligase family protein n=1 Tax=unclassified Streptomyces TaxID=2593676 RepID=UPI002DD86D1E|nr:MULTISPECIES: D-alanine--D-alanine ligase family protein [unclassified Streptomyces]WSA91643.1 D-alanine--D-alanine ligase [Streptomyces sp. NBC_01795]WSB76015.1 D-alanine--D-alanine ligase [Streptomyces sp. NBC_01775]WSS15711.1 D-alanine--D-alanine ligase [Streptomyces sp. NBC_01186]WSS44551.1 D-alanine--D-alanine ligase [Streptomyces sp. NBC_01187]
MSERGAKKTVVVMFGGRSSEYDVSVDSGAAVTTHLDRSRYEVVPVRITPDGEWVAGKDDASLSHYDAQDLIRLTPSSGAPVRRSIAEALNVMASADVVIPVFHGPYGEDGLLQGLLEMADIPYVGSGVLSCAVGMDKDVTKRLLSSAGLPVAASVVLDEESQTSLSQQERERLGLPVFVKPATAGSSMGVSRVESWDALPEAIAKAQELDTKVLVEEAVPCREIDVALLAYPDGRVEAGPALEISVGAGRGFFDHSAKYADHSARFDIPAQLDEQTAIRVRDLALNVFKTLGCRGLLRADFFLKEDGSLVVNEVNTFPGLTAASQYPQVWKAAGLDYPELLDVLIETAIST